MGKERGSEQGERKRTEIFYIPKCDSVKNVECAELRAFLMKFGQHRTAEDWDGRRHPKNRRKSTDEVCNAF